MAINKELLNPDPIQKTENFDNFQNQLNEIKAGFWFGTLEELPINLTRKLI